MPLKETLAGYENLCDLCNLKMENVVTYWNRCLEMLRGQLSQSAFRTWFAPIIPLEYKDNVLVLQVKSPYVVEYIEENYLDILSKVLNVVYGKGIKLEYRVLIDSHSGAGSTIHSKQSAQMPVSMPTVDTPKNAVEPNYHPAMPELDSQLNSLYTFETFIAGESNKLARTAGITISKQPGKTIFNPLFIYGGSGVGKTHLVNAIGNAIKQIFPEKRVLYVSANTFQVQYQDAVIANHVNDFINFYQTIDVLIVDDIQYWSEKKGTQNTFFFIFNHLHQTGKQLILTSDKSPVELRGLEERLITRFKWGLSAELHRPDFQLRKDILKSRIYRDGLEIPDEIINYIAENVRENVRDLEGVLASLLAYSTLTDEDINMELTEQVVARLVNVASPDMSIDHITAAVCEQFNISEDMLYTSTRKKEVAQARQVAMYLAKKLTDKSLVEIGKLMGDRNHATVIHSINAIKKQLEYDAFLRRSIKQIENVLRS